MSSQRRGDAAKPPSPPPYDQALANQATAIEQCMKLGGVVLSPPSKPKAGFGGT